MKIADIEIPLNTWFVQANLSYEVTLTGSGPDRQLTIANTYQKIGPWKQTADGDLRVQTLPVESGSDKAQASGVFEFGASEHPSFSSVKFSVGAETTCELHGTNVNPGLEQVLTVSVEIRPNRVALGTVAVVATSAAILYPEAIPAMFELGRRILQPGPVY